jgi:dTMP kinase
VARAAGLLIVFEGGEGSGKSTQLRLLADALAGAGIAHRCLREPGGTPLGAEVRRLLLDREWELDARAEALLFMASRAQLVVTELRPALERGEVVLLDRFFLSTYAYQMGGRSLPEVEVRAANALATAGLTPDLTLLLTFPVASGLARAAERSAAHDRMEREGHAFHAQVAAAFEQFAAPDWQRAVRSSLSRRWEASGTWPGACGRRCRRGGPELSRQSRHLMGEGRDRARGRGFDAGVGCDHGA